MNRVKILLVLWVMLFLGTWIEKGLGIALIALSCSGAVTLAVLCETGYYTDGESDDR